MASTKNNSETVVKSTYRMCHGICDVLVHIRDGKVIKVSGDPDCPTSLGYTCAKGRASPELLFHPDRLEFPLKRVGAKGENKWQRDIMEGKHTVVCIRIHEDKHVDFRLQI